MYQKLAADQTAEPFCDKRWLGTPQQERLIKERARIYSNIENAIGEKILKNGKDSKYKAYDLLNVASTKKKSARGTTRRSRRRRRRRSRRPKRKSRKCCKKLF